MSKVHVVQRSLSIKKDNAFINYYTDRNLFSEKKEMNDENNIDTYPSKCSFHSYH